MNWLYWEIVYPCIPWLLEVYEAVATGAWPFGSPIWPWAAELAPLATIAWGIPGRSGLLQIKILQLDSCHIECYINCQRKWWLQCQIKCQIACGIECQINMPDQMPDRMLEKIFRTMVTHLQDLRNDPLAHWPPESQWGPQATAWLTTWLTMLTIVYRRYYILYIIYILFYIYIYMCVCGVSVLYI